MKHHLGEEMVKLGAEDKPFLFPEHHVSQPASAFYPSPFPEAAILTLDGVGEWATKTTGHGKGKDLSILRELHFPHSLGLFYSAFTYYCGFKVNSGEYKLMGLAPYKNLGADQTQKWIKLILNELIDLQEDGSLLLNMKYFDFTTDLTMCHDEVWEKLFGVPRQKPETEITQPYMNMALAIQDITEEVVLRLANSAKDITASDYLVMAGGVALNCVANDKILRKGLFKDLWIQPGAGDVGGALGAALAAWHIWKGQGRYLNSCYDAMEGAYLGPNFSDGEIKQIAKSYRAPYTHYESFDDLCKRVVDRLMHGRVVGWFQGRMEFGPRVLGNRSILGVPRHSEMQKKRNLKIKYREGFRPFAPSVLAEECHQYFNLNSPSPYMLLVAPVKEERRNPLPPGYHSLPLYDRLYHLRSDIPTITHIDYSARIQTVHKETNERYWRPIQAFKECTGYGLVVNTRFNVRGEPIVCTPNDAYRCFMRTEMDDLVMENFLFEKEKQPPWREEGNWGEKYGLD